MTVAIALKYPWGPQARAVDPLDDTKPLVEPGVILLADSQYSYDDPTKDRPGKKIQELGKGVAVTFATKDIKLSERAIWQARAELRAVTWRSFNVNDATTAIGKGMRQALTGAKRRTRMSFLVGMVVDDKPIVVRFDNPRFEPELVPDFTPPTIPDRSYIGHPDAGRAFFNALLTERLGPLDYRNFSGWATPALSALAQVVTGGYQAVDGPIQHLVVTRERCHPGEVWKINPADTVATEKIGVRPSDLQG
jgi:hypothetical protein